MNKAEVEYRFNIDAPDYGFVILDFLSESPEVVVFSVVLAQNTKNGSKADDVNTIPIDEWSYSKYRCSGVRHLVLENPSAELKGWCGANFQMFWESARKCFLVDVEGFIFDCGEIEVIESTHEKLGLLQAGV